MWCNKPQSYVDFKVHVYLITRVQRSWCVCKTHFIRCATELVQTTRKDKTNMMMSDFNALRLFIYVTQPSRLSVVPRQSDTTEAGGCDQLCNYQCSCRAETGKLPATGGDQPGTWAVWRRDQNTRWLLCYFTCIMQLKLIVTSGKEVVFLSPFLHAIIIYL